MKINDKFKGAFCGILAAITFGTNPFFGVSLYQHGFNTASVLFYRFFVAFLLMLVCMFLRKESFKLSRKQLLLTMICGVFLALTCLFFYMSFHLLDTGIAATILFVYPLMVGGIMFLVYHVKQSLMTIFGMIFGIAGIVVLSLGNISGKFSMLGLFYVLLSALVYALYMVMLKVTSLKDMPSMPLTFYAMGFSVPVFFIISGFGTHQSIHDMERGKIFLFDQALQDCDADLHASCQNDSDKYPLPGLSCQMSCSFEALEQSQISL